MDRQKCQNEELKNVSNNKKVSQNSNSSEKLTKISKTRSWENTDGSLKNNKEINDISKTWDYNTCTFFNK